MFELHEQGIAVPTYTTLDGKFAIRVAHTNHRTRYEDFDLLVREVVRLGKEILRDHKEPVVTGLELAPLVFGLSAAACWGAGDFCGGVATKATQVYRVIISSQLISLILLVMLAVAHAGTAAADSVNCCWQAWRASSARSA